VATNPGDWMIHCHMPHHMMNQMSSMAGPMTRRAGMPAGAGTEQGMGIMSGGAATAAENGPSMGRGMGVGSALTQLTTNGTMTPQSPAQSSARSLPSQQPSPGMGGMQMGQADVSKDANSVPGFPQDAFMESPAMAMDAMVEKPETHGLRPGWSGYMQGMMTLIRVLPPDRYDEIERLREQRRKNGSATMPEMNGSSEKR
jgi:hypothetical protein